MRPVVRCVAATGDYIGEGAVWHAAHQAVYWADIDRCLIHRFTPIDQCVRSWFFDEPVTAVVLTDRDGALAVVLGSRVILWAPASDARTDQGFRLTGWPEVRLNDARADPRGSLWAGSMGNHINPDGSLRKIGAADGLLHRIDPDGQVKVFRRGVGISNTVAWSPDGGQFYFGDSLANVIWVYDYDRQTCSIENERPFFEGFSRGIPDGSAVDRQGYLWNCRYDGGCIVRVAPDGTVDVVIEMPVQNVTTCTFGGADLKTLYVTTARGGQAERLAGGLFALDVGVAGVEERRFRVFGGK